MKVLDDGAHRARSLAEDTLKEVRGKLGLRFESNINKM